MRHTRSTSFALQFISYIIHYELLEPNQSIHANIHSQQMGRPNSELIKKKKWQSLVRAILP